MTLYSPSSDRAFRQGQERHDSASPDHSADERWSHDFDCQLRQLEADPDYFGEQIFQYADKLTSKDQCLVGRVLSGEPDLVAVDALREQVARWCADWMQERRK